MIKENFAALLNGREYGEEISREEQDSAKRLGLIVIFGYSDDCLEFRGTIHDETYPDTDGEIPVLIDAEGLLKSWDQVESEEDGEDYFRRKKAAIPVLARYGEKGWEISTEIPFASFDIVSGSEKYGNGLVLSVADIQAAASK